MKNIYSIFFLCLLIISCKESEEMMQEEEVIVSTSLTGILQCIDSKPLPMIEIIVTDEMGATQSTTTDVAGNYSFDNLALGDYIMSFTDPSFYDYSTAQYDMMYQDLEDVVLAARPKTNIDHIAYNFINYEDGLTTFDLVMIDRLRNGDIAMNDIELPWRYVFTTELDTNPAVTNQLAFTYTDALILDITAIFVGDNSGLVCQ